METLTKTFLIEANRQDSVETQQYAVDTKLTQKNTAEWTNIIHNCNLKAGDILTLDNAVINARGSGENSMEFTGENVDNDREYSDNFMIMEFGRYINHSNNYTIGLPIQAKDQPQDGADKQLLFYNNPLIAQGQIETQTEPLYGRYDPLTTANGKKYIFNGYNDPNDPNNQQNNGLQLVSFTEPDNYIFPSCINTFSVLDQNKYSIINTKFRGAWRPDMNPVGDYNADLLVGRFKISVPIGFESPNNLAGLITKCFNQTYPQNIPFEIIPRTKILGGFTDDNWDIQPRLQGQAVTTIACNGELKWTSNDNDPIYQSIGTDEPLRYSTGCNIILQTDLADLGQDYMAWKSPAKNTGNFTASTTTIGQPINVTITEGQLDNVKPNDILVVISGDTVLSNPFYVLNITINTPTTAEIFYNGNITQGSNDPTTFTIKGGGQFITPMPIYLFGNYDSTTNTYDYYSPHNNNPSFDLDTAEFGGNPDEYIFGNITFSRNNFEDYGDNEYNYNITQSPNSVAGSPLLFLQNLYIKWVGSDGSPENYAIVGNSPNDYDIFPFRFVSTAPNAGAITFIYDEFRYDGIVYNNLNNGRDIQNYAPGPQGSNPFSEYNYRVETAENPNLIYFVRKVFLREKHVAVYDSIGNLLTFGINNQANNRFINFSPILDPTFRVPYTLHFNKGGTDTNAPEYLESVTSINLFGNKTKAVVSFWFKFEVGVLGGAHRMMEIQGNDFLMSVDENNGTMSIRNIKVATGTFQSATTVNGSISEGVWHHAYIKIDKANPNNSQKCEIYIDGVNSTLQSEWTDPTPFRNVTGPISVGGWGGGNARDFVGNITNLAIYSLDTNDDYPSLTNSYNNGYIWDARKIQPDVGDNYIAPTVYYFLGKGDEPVGNSLTIRDQMGVGPNLESVNFNGDEIETTELPPINEITESYWESQTPFVEFKDEQRDWTKVGGNVEEIDGNYMDMPQHQIIPTNILYNEKNISLIAKFLLSTEQYEGTETEASNIENDIYNYSAQLDMGRSSDYGDIDGEYNVLNPIKNFTDPEKALFFSWMPGNADPDPMKNETIVAPRMITGKNSDNYEQRFNVFTRYKNNATTRLKYVGSAPYYEDIDLNNTDLSTGQLFYFNDPNPLNTNRNYDDSLSQKYGVAVYPIYYLKRNDSLTPSQSYETIKICAFEFFETNKRFPQDELYKIMWGTPAIFSPQFADHNQVLLINLENTNGTPYVPPDPSADPPTSGEIDYSENVEDYCPYVNIGAGSATCSYNETLNRFDFSYLHEPRKLSSAESENDAGNEVAVFFDTPLINPLTTDTGGTFNSLRNPYINDSLAGLFIKDFYFQSAGLTDIQSIDDSRVVVMDKVNFFGSLPWKMGFTIRDLKPIRFSVKPFNNRYNSFFQNNYSSYDERQFTLSPITTNSDVNVSGFTSLNIIPINLPNNGEPKFGLGGASDQRCNLDVRSNEITATNLNSAIDNGFYRIYCDLPMSSFRYIGAQQDLGAIGVALRNYSSSGFYFAYSTSYQIEITKDQPLNTIRTVIRNAQGKVARNLNEKCCVFYKIQRQVVTQSAPPPKPDPVLKELKEIDDQLEQNDKNEAMRDDDFEEKLEQILKIELPEEVGEKIPSDIRQRLQKELINSLIQRLIKTFDREKLTNRDKIAMAQGVESYFSRNRKEIGSALSAIDTARTKDDIRKLSRSLRGKLRNFRLTPMGLDFSRGELETNFRFKRGFYKALTNKIYNIFTTTDNPNFSILDSFIVEKMGKGEIIGTPSGREMRRTMTRFRDKRLMKQRREDKEMRQVVEATPENVTDPEYKPKELQQTPDIKQ